MVGNAIVKVETEVCQNFKTDTSRQIHGSRDHASQSYCFRQRQEDMSALVTLELHSEGFLCLLRTRDLSFKWQFIWQTTHGSDKCIMQTGSSLWAICLTQKLKHLMPRDLFLLHTCY